MRIFVFEHLTGGCLVHDRSPLAAPSLLAEGAAMLQAVLADFALFSDGEVCTICDARLRRTFSFPPRVVTHWVGTAAAEDAISQQATAADWTLLIAPETDGVLLKRCRLVESVGGRLLSPSSACVEIAASKQATASWL